MSRHTETRYALSRVRQEASAARAFYYTWWALNCARGDTQLSNTMNNSYYVDFFSLALAGTFRLVFVSLGAVFDTNLKTMCMHHLIRILPKDDSDRLKILCKKHQNTIEGIWKIRSKTIAHNDPETVGSVFCEAGVTPNQIKGLIDDTCEEINAIATRPPYKFNHISGGSRNTRSVEYLLDFLKSSSFLEEQVSAEKEV